MRLLVHGGSLATGGARLAAALTGLAARGHDLAWLGPGAPAAEGVRPLPGARALQRLRADLVVGHEAAARLALAGWRSRARGMILGVSLAGRPHRPLADRMARDLVPSLALLEETESEAAREAFESRHHERIVLWPPRAPAEPSGPAHPDVELLERACERLLARLDGRPGRPAVFADRDGTLIVERGYLSDPDQVELLPGVATALRQLADVGLPVVVISNQSGVGRGRFTLTRAHETMARLRRLLRAHDVELASIRFCPHAPEQRCACRKPGTRLLEEAAEDLRLSLPASVMVGDKRLDAHTGQAAGALGVLVRTGYGAEEERAVEDGAAPERVFDDFAAATAWILARRESL